MRVGFLGLALAGMTVSAPQAETGLKILARETMRAGTIETAEYVDSTRRRLETQLTPTAPDISEGRRHRGAHIVRCDLQQTIYLDLDDRTYMSSSMRPSLRTFLTSFPWVGFSIEWETKSPSLLIETTTVQTGERKSAFGYTARRVITTRRHIPLDSNRDVGAEITTDGWYIDLDAVPSCLRSGEGTRTVVLASGVSSNGGRTRAPGVTFKEVGAPERGYPIETKITWRSTPRPATAAGNMYPDTTHRVVVQLSREPLDPALFEIPQGFRSSEGRLAALTAHLGRAWLTLEYLVGSVFK